MQQNVYISAGKRIKKMRIKCGYTREQLAELANISPKFLYEIEIGNKGFSAQTLSMLAKQLNVSCDYILFGITECNSIQDIDKIINQFPDEKTDNILTIFNAIYNLLYD